MAKAKRGQLRGNRNLDRLAKIPQTKMEAQMKRELEFGLEAAQILLGHSKAGVTQVYAEIDKTKAIELVKAIG